MIPEPFSERSGSPGMRAALRLLVAFVVLAPCVLVAGVRAGDFLPQTDCDTVSVAGQTVYEFAVWPHGGSPALCMAEIRPRSIGILPVVPITAFAMADDWTAEWIPDEPGAIRIRGCAEPDRLGPRLHITLPGRAAGLAFRLHREGDVLYRDDATIFWCGSPPVPAAASTWGRLKSAHR